MQPSYDLDKIRFATDRPTFEKAVALYESGKIGQFKEDFSGYFAIVLGASPYRVYVSAKYYDQGDCECYLGQNNTLCKHMVAVAIYACLNGKKLSQEDKKLVSSPTCSGKMGELDKEDLAEIKKSIASAIKYIKPYRGPSRIWFAYQNSLSEGCARLSKLVSGLPVSWQTARLIIDLLLRLDKKLCLGGVDDSDGTVGGFIEEAVIMLENYAKLVPSCVKTFSKLKGKETCFNWEEPLLKLIK